MKRGSKRLFLGWGLLGAGVVVFLWSFAGLYMGRSLDPQFAAAGSHEVRAEGVGLHYVWDNYQTWFEGERVEHGQEFPEDVRVAVRTSDGNGLGFVEDASEGWSIGNHGKKSVGYVTLAEPTVVTIEVSGGDGKRVLSFSNSEQGPEVYRKLRGFGVAAVLAVLGLPLIFVGWIVRRRAWRLSLQSEESGTIVS